MICMVTLPDALRKMGSIKINAENPNQRKRLRAILAVESSQVDSLRYHPPAQGVLVS